MAYTFPLLPARNLPDVAAGQQAKSPAMAPVCVFLKNGRLMGAGGIAAVERERARADVYQPPPPKGAPFWGRRCHEQYERCSGPSRALWKGQFAVPDGVRAGLGHDLGILQSARYGVL